MTEELIVDNLEVVGIAENQDLVIPVKDFATQTGWNLSMFQKNAIDMYVETGSWSKVAKELKCSTKFIEEKCSYPEARNYLANKLENLGISLGISKESWIAEAVKRSNSKEEKMGAVQAQYFKMIGDAKGFFKDSGVVNQTNVQVNITQANGES